MTDNPFLQAALTYLSRGYSVIPIRPDKKPFIRWEKYQKEKGTAEEIKIWFTRWPSSMIGIVTGSISGIVVVDADSQKGIDEFAKVCPVAQIPMSKTPRGGVHFYFKAPEKPIGNNTRALPDVDFRGERGYVIAPPSINGTGKGYEWFPGLSLDDIEPPPLPEPYIVFINSLAVKGYEWKKEGDFNRLQVTSGDFKMFTEGRRDNDLFHVANIMVKGGGKPEEITQVLENLIISWGENPDQKWVKEKIDSALKRMERKDRNLSEEVRDFIVTSSGFFLTSECFNRLQLTSREDKKAVVLALLRFKKEGVIERHGDKNGCYRRIDREYIKIDLQSASGKPLDMRWPFGIERYYRPFPKNLITVMGTPDAGKSAFLFNVARENMDKFKIHYFSSEMGADELWDRLANFGIPKEEWTKKCELIERSSNFSDVIFPDDINIIDYLDMTGGEGKEFYKVGEFLEHIYEKLRAGIAIVGIQKNYGQDLGRGGLGTIERPRLALAMESSKIKIIKCKNWVDKKFNPNHLQLEYKLVDGCRFIIQKDWYRV